MKKLLGLLSSILLATPASSVANLAYIDNIQKNNINIYSEGNNEIPETGARIPWNSEGNPDHAYHFKDITGEDQINYINPGFGYRRGFKYQWKTESGDKNNNSFEQSRSFDPNLDPKTDNFLMNMTFNTSGYDAKNKRIETRMYGIGKDPIAGGSIFFTGDYQTDKGQIDFKLDKIKGIDKIELGNIAKAGQFNATTISSIHEFDIYDKFEDKTTKEKNYLNDYIIVADAKDERKPVFNLINIKDPFNPKLSDCTFKLQHNGQDIENFYGIFSPDKKTVFNDNTIFLLTKTNSDKINLYKFELTISGEDDHVKVTPSQPEHIDSKIFENDSSIINGFAIGNDNKVYLHTNSTSRSGRSIFGIEKNDPNGDWSKNLVVKDEKIEFGNILDKYENISYFTNTEHQKKDITKPEYLIFATEKGVYYFKPGSQEPTVLYKTPNDSDNPGNVNDYNKPIKLVTYRDRFGNFKLILLKKYSMTMYAYNKPENFGEGFNLETGTKIIRGGVLGHYEVPSIPKPKKANSYDENFIQYIDGTLIFGKQTDLKYNNDPKNNKVGQRFDAYFEKINFQKPPAKNHNPLDLPFDLRSELMQLQDKDLYKGANTKEKVKGILLDQIYNKLNESNAFRNSAAKHVIETKTNLNSKAGLPSDPDNIYDYEIIVSDQYVNELFNSIKNNSVANATNSFITIKPNLTWESRMSGEDLSISINSDYLKGSISSSENPKKGISVWVIVGIVLGIFILIGLIAVLVIVLKKKKSTNKKEK